jgi:two-component system phosphate regulon response regulator PhoB
MDAVSKYILVADDDHEVAECIKLAMEAQGFACRAVLDGREVLEVAPRQRPDLIILDRVFPNSCGDEILSELKRDPMTAGIPVLMVSGMNSEQDEVSGLNWGADDYLAKPFSVDRLQARVLALLRRKSPQIGQPFVAARATIAQSQEIYVDGTVRHLTPLEHTLLRGLAAAGGCAVTKRQITQLIEASGDNSRVNIDDLVISLQSHLGNAGAFIHRLGSSGYAYCAPQGTRLRV